MPVEDARGEEVETAYNPPDHLEHHDSVGPIPTRVFFLGLAAWVLTQMTLGMESYYQTDAVGHAVLLLGPTILLLPFGLWFLSPPPEHGLAVWVRHLFRGTILGPDQLKAYHKMYVKNGVVFTGNGKECLMIWQLPTVNLEIASEAGKRRHQSQWGKFLDSLGHEVVFAIRARKLRRLDVVSRIFEHGSFEAKELARWFMNYLAEQAFIERVRLIVIPAPDPTILASRCKDIRASMATFDWVPIEAETDFQLEAWANMFWTTHPADTGRIGPSMIQRGPRDLMIDGEPTRVYALGGFPASILTNWWSHLFDDDLPVDGSLYIEPKSVWQAKHRLDTKYNLLSTSRPTHGRLVAMEQITALRMSMELNKTRPYDAALTLAIRASTSRELDDLDNRLKQRVRDRGNANLQLLQWEQLDGFDRIAPLGHKPLPKRVRTTESGTLARTCVLASTQMQLAGGVPLGMAGSAPCTFWTRAGQKNAHMALYGGSGAGKGWLMRVMKSRIHFAHDICLWGIDSDPDQEYSGRFCRYLHGQSPPIKEAADVDKVPIGRDSRVVMWDLSQCSNAEYGDAAVRIVDRMVAAAALYSWRMDFWVDEATDLLRHPLAADRVEQLLQKGRKSDIGVTLVTQLVTDWLGTDAKPNPLGRRVHGLVDSWWCGQQNGGELDAVASALRLTSEEKAKLINAPIGTGLLATFNASQRVWLDLRNKCSEEEHAMAHTTPRTAETPRRRIRHIEELLEAEQRNGHTNGVVKVEELREVSA